MTVLVSSCGRKGSKSVATRREFNHFFSPTKFPVTLSRVKVGNGEGGGGGGRHLSSCLYNNGGSRSAAAGTQRLAYVDDIMGEEVAETGSGELLLLLSCGLVLAVVVVGLQ